MSTMAFVRDQAGNYLGAVPMDHGEWWMHGDRFRFGLQVPLEDWADLAAAQQADVQVESVVLEATRWCRGGHFLPEWCLRAAADDIQRLVRIPGFKPRRASGTT